MSEATKVLINLLWMLLGGIAAGLIACVVYMTCAERDRRKNMKIENGYQPVPREDLKGVKYPKPPEGGSGQSDMVYQWKSANDDKLIKTLKAFHSSDIKSALLEEIEKNGTTNIERNFIDRIIDRMVF